MTTIPTDGLSWAVLKSALESRAGYPIDRARIIVDRDKLTISFDAYGRMPETRTTTITDGEKAMLAGLVRKVSEHYKPDSIDGIDCRVSWLTGNTRTRVYFTTDNKRMYHDENGKC